MGKKVFIAAPISGYNNKSEYKLFRQFILLLIKELRLVGFVVCSEVEQISREDNYDSPTKSVNEDFSNIHSSDIFLMLHPKIMQTSTLIELGYACADHKTVVLVGKTDNFPYLAKGLVDSEIPTRFVKLEIFNKKGVNEIVEVIKLL